jgi:gliding motility-associated-like protein
MLGTYTVTGKSSQGCSVKATATVGFIPTSSITTTPSYTICQGGTQTFSLTNAIGATSYSWAGPLAFVSSVQNPTISSIMTTQAGIYTVTANFTSGTYTCTTTKTSTVIVVPAYPASLPAMSTVCNNGIINLTAPIGGTTYNWAWPNSFTSSAQSPNITSAGIINNGIYTVTITTGLCVNIGTVAVTVYNPLSFMSIPSNLTLCFGKSGVLNSNGAGGSGIYNYSWSPITDLSNPNSATTTVTGSSTTIYSLTLTDANCAVTLGAVTPVTVTVNPSPVITMSTTNSRGCEAFCTDLISLSVPTSTYCEWRFTDNLAYGGCYNPNFCFPTHGVYGATLTVTDVNGCIDSVKNSSFIIVDPNPSADFSWTPDNSTILINEVNFYDHSSIGLPFNNWHWDFGDVFVNDANDTSNIQNPSHIYENVYSYSVKLTVVNSFGCRDSVMKLLKVEDDFALFIPNAFTPSKADGKNDIFKVSGIGFLSDSFEMRIFDRWGELVFKTNDINKGWDGSIKGGKLANPDVFIYKITIKDFKNKTREYVGHITIL